MSMYKLYAIGVVIGLVVAGIVGLAVRWQKGAPSAPAPSVSAPVDESAYASWQSVAPPSGLFRARFPSAPQVNSSTAPIAGSDAVLAQELYTAADDKGVVYFVSTAVYPVAFDPAKSGENLQTALDGMVGAIAGAQLLSKASTGFKGSPSLEFIIQDANKTLHQGKLILNDRTLYQAFVSYNEGALDEQEYRYFLQSFQPTSVK